MLLFFINIVPVLQYCDSSGFLLAKATQQVN